MSKIRMPRWHDDLYETDAEDIVWAFEPTPSINAVAETDGCQWGPGRVHSPEESTGSTPAATDSTETRR